MKNQDNPGVYIPPPLFYVAFFFLSIGLQKVLPLQYSLQIKEGVILTGWIFIALWILFIIPALLRFVSSKNTLVTIKPARSLQTTGIYSICRNPMYSGLLCLYIGISCLKGNDWSLILVPLLVVLIQSYVIKREEIYLERTFGTTYLDYKKRVRRWI